MSGGDRVLEAAKTLIGARFRLHGRDPDTGIDCLGLIGCTLAAVAPASRLPVGYGLRQRDWARLLPLAAELGLEDADPGGGSRPGDILLFEVGAWQVHLAIDDGEGAIIHAHAGLARVVHGRPDPSWMLSRRWRLATNPIK